MPADLHVPLPVVAAFVLALFRIGGAFIFVPIPGVRTGPSSARIAISLSLTLSLFPKWATFKTADLTLSMFIASSLSELALGVTVGLFVSFIIEMAMVGAQAISLPAGYTYASTIDPATQAESNVLVILAQLTSGLLFFAFGLHRQLILILARSFERYPAGAFVLTDSMAQQVLRIGSMVFDAGFRLVLPVLAFLVMIDISLGLLGRLNAQIQVLTVSFPAKMLVSLVLLAMMGEVGRRIFVRVAGQVMSVVAGLISG